MRKNLFIKQLDALESDVLINKEQSKTILKISVVLFVALGVTFIFKDNICSLLRHHHPQEMTASQKAVQSTNIATAD